MIDEGTCRNDSTCLHQRKVSDARPTLPRVPERHLPRDWLVGLYVRCDNTAEDVA